MQKFILYLFLSSKFAFEMFSFHIWNGYNFNILCYGSSLIFKNDNYFEYYLLYRKLLQPGHIPN